MSKSTRPNDVKRGVVGTKITPAPWQQLRTWKGSQHDAFEELCCQIAHSEQVPNSFAFRRKGRPDSGIECYWELSDGREWAWQAKFFPEGLDDNRWIQCDDSVKKALEGHPLLARLYFCIPHNLADSRVPGRRSAAERWDQRRKKWTEWAETLSRNVEFLLWDEHELFLRLSKAEHLGRSWFWFNGPALDEEWFRRQFAAAASLAAASDRYTSDFNVELPVASHFEALGRTPIFVTKLESLGVQLNDALVRLKDLKGMSRIKGVTVLKSRLQKALGELSALSTSTGMLFDLGPLKIAVADTATVIREISGEIFEKRRLPAPLTQRLTEEFAEDFPDYNFAYYVMNEVADILAKVARFCESLNSQLAHTPAMSLVGEAGHGKTQLVCTVAERRIAIGLPTILMLGEQFDDVELWSCIIRKHGLSCDRDVFLGALNAVGEACGCRVLIIIDAINEGVGIPYWNKHLASMLSYLRNFTYIGFVFTVRKAYEGQLKGADPKLCVRIEHKGFAGSVRKASIEFFKHYGLSEPSVPLLNPEFENPLLLKLLCRAVRGSRDRQVSGDILGITSVFNLVIQRINGDLAAETALDYDEGENLVQKAVSGLAAVMARRGNEFVPLETAKQLLQEIYPSVGYSRSLLKHLIAEHVVVRMPMPGSCDGEYEVLRFAYQRLSDHLIVQNILAQTTPEELSALFASDGVFGRRMATGWIYDIAGWIEALAIQLPERYGLEIDEVLKMSISEPVLRDSFLKSVVWRKCSAFTEATSRRVEALLKPWDEDAHKVLDELITVTARSDHPFNGDWLDRLLRPLSMAERDSCWSIFLSGQMQDERSIHRLIEWAWAERAENLLSDEIVRLGALTLTWCLTTSDRFVRDRATKALVALLEQRIQVLSWLLSHFSDIDEPYVQERLYAVGYACVMRTSQTAELGSFAQSVYDRIFRDGSPPASVLLRDHARGVIDCAVCRGSVLKYQISRIIPPFNSKWPKSPPTLKKLGGLYHSDDYSDAHRGLRRIFQSVTNDDFERYVIRDVTDWSNQRRKRKSRVSPREWFQDLLRTLPEEDVNLLKSYETACASIESRRSDHEEEESLQMWRKYLEIIDGLLPEILGKRKSQHFAKYIAPYLNNQSLTKLREIFSVELFQRLILRRVLELGWTSERFGAFDEQLHSVGREANKPERIGKKYQWIAYDEFHARISDNFEMANVERPSMSDRDWKEGLWPINFRDIDPTLLLKSTPRDGWGANHMNWWTSCRYDAWTSHATQEEWLRSTSDLPPPKDFLELNAPDDQRWMMLEGFARWQRKLSVGEIEGKDEDNQEIHYIFKSYIVRREHLQGMMAWGHKQNWINDRMPQPEHRLGQHLHEHFCSAHFGASSADEWISKIRSFGDVPNPFVRTTSEYICEDKTYDCSLDSTVLISLPSRWLAEKMKLRMAGRNGDFLNGEGRIIAFDPSTREKGHCALVVRQEALRELLDQEGLALIWTLLGEKNIYPPEQMRAWPGRLTVLGIYSWEGGAIEGGFRKEFTEGRE